LILATEAVAHEGQIEFVLPWVATVGSSPGRSFAAFVESKLLPTFPLELTPALPRIASGYSHGLLLRDGLVWSWGSNQWGELGDGSPLGDSRTDAQPLELTGVVNLWAGLRTSAALREDGSLWTWGDYAGEPGFSELPVPVSIDQVVAADAGGSSLLALREDGSVWQWGAIYGTVEVSGDLLEVPGLAGVAISAGTGHALALEADGTVWAWGLGQLGQLGDGLLEDSLVPVQVAGLDDAVAIVAGTSESLARRSDGSWWGWGSNYYGQLGVDGMRSTPVRLPAFDGMVDVGLGETWAVALDAQGVAWAISGRLQTPDPYPLEGPLPFTALSVEGPHALLLASDGAVYEISYGGYVPPTLARVPGT
jgi:alpha-tubulin suppressor-like RCC1 family protein